MLNKNVFYPRAKLGLAGRKTLSTSARPTRGQRFHVVTPDLLNGMAELPCDF